MCESERNMTTNEIKVTLLEKFRDENCYFKLSDIKCRKIKDGYKVIIKDYEHIEFKIRTELDDYFGYCVWVDKYEYGERNNIIFRDSKVEYRMKDAIISLGYYIATRF